MISEKKKTLADCIAEFIAEKKSPGVFQLSGGMTAFMLDAIARLGRTPIINTRHEQAAGFAAEGSARVSGIAGFAFGTSGPGATNLLTPIASSYFDSVPVVYITGQVNQKELRQNSNQRQNGFQELDICRMAESITKKVYKPSSAKEVMASLEEGWKLALENRQGPVLIDIPINLQQEFIELAPSTRLEPSERQAIAMQTREAISSMMGNACRPLVLVGGGVRIDDSVEKLSDMLKKSDLPYVTSLMGLDCISHNSPNYLGFIGSYGNRWANYALSKADLLIVLGSRLDVRQTGNSIEKFIEGKRIIRIDIDEHELSGRIKSDLALKMTVSEFLDIIMEYNFPISNTEYRDEVIEIKSQFPQPLEQIGEILFNPSNLMEMLSKIFAEAAGYIVDVGQHQMWAAQSLHLSEGQRLLTSGGLGAMGFALPASIGAAIATNQKWICITGDGCLQLSIAELQTIVHYNLPIAICLINNKQHGMVAQFQQENMGGRLIGTSEGYSTPDFQELASAFGLQKVYKITSEAEMIDLLDITSNWVEGPIFIEFVLDANAKALPKLGIK
jgi:acetolactate synthase-1/2/3 large subunit